MANKYSADAMLKSVQDEEERKRKQMLAAGAARRNSNVDARTAQASRNATTSSQNRTTPTKPSTSQNRTTTTKPVQTPVKTSTTSQTKSGLVSLPKFDMQSAKLTVPVPTVQSSWSTSGAARRNTNTDARTAAAQNRARASTAAAQNRARASTAARRNTNADARTGTNLSRQNTSGRSAQTQVDRANLQRNMLLWHGADETRKKQLEAENQTIRNRLGLSFEPKSGVSFDATTGQNYSLPTQLAMQAGTVQGARNATNFLRSREMAGIGRDEIAVQPTMQQLMEGQGREASGVNSHQVLSDLYARGDKEWSDRDRTNRDYAVTMLEDEMKNVLQRFGLDYRANSLGTSDSWAVRTNLATDRNALERLRAAGADEATINYIAENIALREGTHRVTEAGEAAGKGFAGSLLSNVETTRQQSRNVAASRENPEYVRLETQAENLRAQLTSMSSDDGFGNVPAEYMRLYNELQETEDALAALTDVTPVDQSLPGQTLVRESQQAAANATAGMSAVPRFLTNTGISVASNAPGMLASAIPGVGTVLGAAILGAQASGSRMAELNAQGAAPSEALARGIVSGGIEMLTEKIPLDNLADIFRGGGTSAVRSILRQMGIEATEEGASYALNYVADRAAQDPNAEFSPVELMQQMLGGALSGGVFGGAGVAGNRMFSALDGQSATQTAQAGNLTPETQNANLGDSGANTAVPLQQEVAPVVQPRQQVQAAAPVVEEVAPNVLRVKENEYGDFEFPKNYSYRHFRADTPMSDYGHAMFADNPEFWIDMPRQLENDTGEGYAVDHSKLVDIDELKPIIAEAWEADRADEFNTYSSGAMKDYVDIDGEEAAELFDPADIVNSAEGYDNGDMMVWLYDRILEPRDILGVKTWDGAVVFDESIIDRLQADRWQEDAQEAEAVPVLAQEPVQQSVPREALFAERVQLDTELQQAQRALPGAARDARVSEISARIAQVNEQLVETENAYTEDLGVNTTVQNEARTFAPGERVRALDRDNYGTIVEQYPDSGWYDVNFYDRNTGRQKTVMMNADDLQVVGEAGTPDAASSERAQAQMDALESDSFMQPGEERITNSDHLRVNDDLTSATLLRAWQDTRRAEARLEDAMQHYNHLTEQDEKIIASALSVGANAVVWNQATNPQDAYYIYTLQQAVQDARAPIREANHARIQKLEMQAEQNADLIANHATDKMVGLAYQRETMERNFYDIFKNAENGDAYAEKLIDEYIAPVHQAVAEGTRLKNELRGRVKALKLDKHESAIVQMLLEGEQGGAAQYIADNNLTLSAEDNAKINNAVEEMRAIYNQLYDEMNDAMLRNGQEPVEYRRDYAPHFVDFEPDTTIGKALYALGLYQPKMDNLPTDLAGITETFRPGKKWFGNLMRRTGTETDYDAVRGFDRYVETAADVITLTDSTQALRYLEDAVRYKLSDDGTKTAVERIRNSRDLDALQKRVAIEELYEQKRTGMPNLVTELRRYTDLLAGKKNRSDRGWEDKLGRDFYNLARNLEGRVASNMITANPGSWLTNFIPLTQATGEVSTRNLLKGMADTVKSYAKNDGFVNASDFLTNRRGSKSIDRTTARMVGDALGAPMEWIDHFTADTIVRARTAQNIENGMGLTDAINEADSFAAGLMADRSTGSMPTLFTERNPLAKMFTMFQLEVNNQLSYLGKDLTRRVGKQGKSAVAAAMTKVFVGAYIYNALYSQLTGRDSALDPIGIIMDAFGIGDEDDEERTGWDVAGELATGIGENLPFVGGLLFEGGRVPISSALPDVGNIVSSLSGDAAAEKKADTLRKELVKPLTYLLPPFGGGAARKAIEGFATVQAGGSYARNNDGERILQFPAYGQTPLDFAKTMLFGKWSSEEAQEYVDNGFKGLNAKETAVYDTLREQIDPREAMSVIDSLRGFETIKDEDGKTVQSVKEQQRFALLENETLTPEQKATIDRMLLVSGEDEQPADYSDRNEFMLSQFVSDTERASAEMALSMGLSIDQYLGAQTALKAAKNAEDVKAKDARRQVFDEIMTDQTLTDGEKRSLVDSVLLSDMGETVREKWETIARGQVDAEEFAQFMLDKADYEAEFSGTGADNAANIAAIIEDYDLDATKSDYLFRTYIDNMENNPFHESVYEAGVKDNAFYADLSEDGRAELRSLLNGYEQKTTEGKELSGWMAKAYMAEREADISPGQYALYQIALDACNADGKGNATQGEAEAAVNMMPGMSQQQKAYLYQSTKSDWKNNPFGSATVGAYVSGTAEAVNPVANGRQSDDFGPREAPTPGASTWHKAIDIAADAGTPVQSIKPGTVTSVGWVSGYGVTVHVDHGDGTESEYHHMQEGSTDGVQVGQTVEAGQQIGRVGSTGVSTGAHLDLQTWKDGKLVDPLTVIPGYGASPSGYVWEGSSSAGAAASARSASAASSSGSGSSSSGLKKLKTLKKLPKFK